ncbi:TraB/GumN family protein (plasmid) [Caulobacter sp. ErkDOM-C]
MTNNKKPATTVGTSSRRQILVGALAAPLSFSALQNSLALAEELQPGSQAPWPLWALRKSGQVVYLTAQTPPRPTAWSDTRIENLIGSCGAIWTETRSVWRGNPNTLVRKYGLNLESPLSGSLSGPDYADVRKAAEIAKVPLDSLEPMRPWLAASQIESAYFKEKGLKEQGTAERVLLSKISSDKIRHASEFDAQDDVITFMGEMSKEEDVQFLQYTVKQIISGTAESERIYGAWANGNRDPATEFVAEMKRSQPSLYAKHVVGRNTNWLPHFTEMQKEAKPSFVIVGIYHMAGPDSLVEYLKQDGWEAKYLS